MKQRDIGSGSSHLDLNRRSFLHAASFAGAAVAIGGFSEAQFAFAQARHHSPLPENMVFLNANENPLGPCAAARAAMLEGIAQSGRYHDEYAEELTNLFASQNGLKPEYVQPYAGSSQPLAYCVLVFCGPGKGVVMGAPGYEPAAFTAKTCDAPAASVALTKEGAHDVRAMVAASSSPGMYYIANPNNPTGTVTSRSDIEWLLANKPRGSIVVLDEAYIHFSDATPCIDLVAADKDVVVLRTFSKLYGMAGARLGLVVARPDLLKRINDRGGFTFCPVPAMKAGIASLKDGQVIALRKKINADVRQETFAWLASQGYTFTASQANCFMIDAKRPTQSVIDGMALQGVLVGRPWPVWPTHVRITVGTPEEMAQFRTAFQKVMETPVTASYRRHVLSRTTLFS
jgi:histidinol-phosphate aminotransferase